MIFYPLETPIFQDLGMNPMEWHSRFTEYWRKAKINFNKTEQCWD